MAYEYKDRRGEVRTIRLVPQSVTDNFYVGHWLLGHLIGDNLQIPVPHGYREITILSLTKGETIPSDDSTVKTSVGSTA